ncbi:Uncharacterized protein Adt_17302 [Abeliophyllum distichum]|uniref:RNase H type-1 domain-containing protein n=1 Tax=Abeliophyllum distichum TaxID=126358 RepID=A0ABD1TG61_9LAMI
MLQHRFQTWRFSGQFVRSGHIHTIIPLLVLSFIWIARNDANHRRISMEPSGIIWRVYHTISLLHTGKLFQFVHWRGDLDLALRFGITLISPTPNPQPPTLVYWRVLSDGSAKINTDGCVRDGFASGGSVIRDHIGHCIRAFSAGYGDIFILEVELRAILQGIELARRMGLVDLWIETDSTLAVHCISRGGGPWVIQSMLRRIRQLLSFDRDTVSHIFREENQVADSLAFEG